jgi:vacuolar-type H+-ATPase subunit I/STV1
MLGLPGKTEIKRRIPKETIQKKFQMDTNTRKHFDDEIKSMTIIHEISPKTMNVTEGDVVKNIFVIRIILKTDTYDEKNIGLIARLINQPMLFVLTFNDKACLAVYNRKLFSSPWQLEEKLKISLTGQKLDEIWDDLQAQVGNIKIENGRNLDQQLELDEKRKQLQIKIERLEKQVRTEKQPKKKFELVEEKKALEKNLKTLI